MNRRQALAYRHKIETAAESQKDEDALQSIELFTPWASLIGTPVAVKKRVQDRGKLYECIQAHTPQDDWHPEDTPALWKEVSVEEWPEFVQPTGAQDAYNTGDKVTFQGQHYICKMDGCTWSPADYPVAWELQP